MKIHVEIADDAWKKALGRSASSIAKAACLAALKAAPEAQSLPKSVQKLMSLSVKLSSDAEVRGLNRDFRGKDKPTNVLSFPAVTLLEDLEDRNEESAYLGDIIIAFETLEREAKEQKKELKAHFCHLLVHGTLHLLGYDHEDDREANLMESLEINVLRELSIANPYATRV